jgi:8-oxo-dGTP pyrophosphatase MutT (NUDIX family)
MNRQQILAELRAYSPDEQHEIEMRRRMEQFVANNERCCDRSLAEGHLTASAWVLDLERASALLTYHGKLDLWVQLGGHLEDDATLLEAAWREAREESGVDEISPVNDKIFDLDIHQIPERQGIAEHLHYDVRFLFSADRNLPLTISPESKNLAWVSLDKISELTREESILRMIRKSKILTTRH